MHPPDTPDASPPGHDRRQLPERTGGPPPWPQSRDLPAEPGLTTLPRLRDLDDAALLAAAVAGEVVQNRQAAQQLELYAELERRCARDYDERTTRTRHAFVLTPRDETGIEVGAALGKSEHKVKLDLLLRERLTAWFPKIWSRCLAGRLDLGKAQLFVDAAQQLADPADIPRLAEAVEDYLDRYDATDSPLCTLSYTRLSRAVRYRRLKYQQKPGEESFAEAFRKRRVWLRVDDTGISTLGVTGAAHDLAACDYRLTLIAKKRCEDPGDERTLAQMRADTMVDLILGRLTVGALDSELEDDETVDGQDPATTFAAHQVGKFARPVVNVTVPLTTLVGFSDAPGFLSGDHAIPADLARLIAADPTSTWHRLLTDPAGRFVELSANRYTPTPAIWRSTVARDRTCVWPNCTRPAVECESDHRIPYPRGSTAITNLDPLCGPHHQAKHSEGYHVDRKADGSYVIRTRRGSVLRGDPSEMP